MKNNVAVAYILMNVELGKELEICENLKKVKEVKEAIPVYGTWDVIVKLSAETMEDIDTAVLKVRQRIKGVENTETLIGTSRK